MLKSLALRVNRVFAMLCLTLALVHSGAVMAKGMDRSQHTSVAAVEHEHVVFSDVVAHTEHADHSSDDTADGKSSEHLAPGHHHGDTGTGAILPVADATANLALSENVHIRLDVRQAPGLHTAGPERPPRLTTLNA